jgi:hypothetical protein
LAEQVRRDMTFGLARARSSLADSLGVLFDDGRELRAHVAAQGLAWDTEVAKLKSIVEDAPVDIMEKALFGATLDDIMTLGRARQAEETRQEVSVGLGLSGYVRFDLGLLGLVATK